MSLRSNTSRMILAMNTEKFIDVWQDSFWNRTFKTILMYMLMGNIQDNHICRVGDLLVTLWTNGMIGMLNKKNNDFKSKVNSPNVLTWSMSLNTALADKSVKEGQHCLIHAQTGSRTKPNWCTKISPLFTCTHTVHSISKSTLSFDPYGPSRNFLGKP